MKRIIHYVLLVSMASCSFYVCGFKDHSKFENEEVKIFADCVAANNWSKTFAVIQGGIITRGVISIDDIKTYAMRAPTKSKTRTQLLQLQETLKHQATSLVEAIQQKQTTAIREHMNGFSADTIFNGQSFASVAQKTGNANIIQLIANTSVASQRVRGVSTDESKSATPKHTKKKTKHKRRNTTHN